MSASQPNSLPDDLFAADRHFIDTPEQTQLQFGIAGIGSRFLAITLDTLIQGAVIVVLMIALFLLALAGFAIGSHLASQAVLVVTIVAAFLIYFGYFAVFEIIWRGQTPGKRILKIRVIKETGRPLSASESIARNLLRIVDQLPSFYAIGVIVALLNKQNKRIGDFVAGAIVVRESALTDVRPVWEHRSFDTSKPQLGAQSLTAEDLAIVDTFIARRSHLNDDVRYNMAKQIAHRIESKIAVGTAHNLSPETLIETAAEERRSMGSYGS